MILPGRKIFEKIFKKVLTNRNKCDIIIIQSREKERVNQMEKYLIVDTETANSLEEPMCYDIGFAVVDKQGNVYKEMSFVVADIFLDKELMDSAYFKDKIPQYWNEIKEGKRVLASWNTISYLFRATVKEYGIEKAYAHNMRFDYRSLTLTQRFITKSKYRYFFPYGLEICDTLKMAREVLGHSQEYREFCESNGYLTANNQLRMTAEIIYRFLSGDNEFIESHTGLEDVMIEKEIFRYCIEHNPEFVGRLWE